LGTAFSVRRTLDRTVVTVSEGLVSVAPSATAEAGHEIRAGAGERVTFSPADNHLSVASVDPAFATAWRQGVLKFVDEPLSAVLDDVNRYAAHPITLEDPRLRERLYTGTVYRGRIEDWLHALEHAFPLQVTQDTSGAVTLTPKDAGE
jgi:transmembrane sensor